MSGLQPGQHDEVDMDWDPDTVVDEEAAMEAEIQRRRSAREEALKRARGVGSNSQVLEVNGGAGSTPLSTRQNSPGPQKPRDGTPRSDSGEFHLGQLSRQTRQLLMDQKIRALCRPAPSRTLRHQRILSSSKMSS